MAGCQILAWLARTNYDAWTAFFTLGKELLTQLQNVKILLSCLTCWALGACVNSLLCTVKSNSVGRHLIWQQFIGVRLINFAQNSRFTPVLVWEFENVLSWVFYDQTIHSFAGYFVIFSSKLPCFRTHHRNEYKATIGLIFKAFSVN